MGFLKPTASNFNLENAYLVKMEDCSTLQTDTVFSSETLVTLYKIARRCLSENDTVFKAKTTCICFGDRQ